MCRALAESKPENKQEEEIQGEKVHLWPFFNLIAPGIESK